MFYDVGSRRFLNVTRRCNLNCIFCPETDAAYRGQTISSPEVGAEASLTDIIDAVCGSGNCREVVFDGIGEPTFRLYDLMQAARYLKHKGIRARLSTNGLADRLHGRSIAPDLEDNIDAVTIALNAHDEESYQRNCRPMIENAFRSALDFVESVKEYVPSVSISAVYDIPSININACRDLARELGVDFEERPITQPC